MKDGIGGRGVMLMQRLRGRPCLERVDLVPAREGDEAFLARGAVREIGLEDALDRLRRVLRLDVAIKLAPERGIGPEAAADQHVIALDRVGLLVLLHLAGEQADLGDEMLRAGMMAAGQMDVDRRVERDARFAPARDLLGMALGVGGGEFAAGIAGAGDEAGADRIGLDGKAERLDPLAAPPRAFPSARRKSAGSARP